MLLKVSRISLGFALMMVFANFALAQKVNTDYSHDANFAQYKTFMWIKEPKSPDPLMRQRIIDDVNATLTGKGLKLVTSDADLAVAAHTATQEERTLDTFYNNFAGGWRWGGGFGTATTRENTYEVGTLVIDLFDAKTKEAVWMGTSSKTISSKPEKNAENLNKAVARMFKDFPPSGREGTR
jgi:hypothetical protein